MQDRATKWHKYLNSHLPHTHQSHRRRLRLESRARSRSVSIKHQLVSSDVEENKMKMKSLKGWNLAFQPSGRKKLSMSSVTKISISHYNHDRFKNLQTTYWYFLPTKLKNNFLLYTFIPKHLLHGCFPPKKAISSTLPRQLLPTPSSVPSLLEQLNGGHRRPPGVHPHDLPLTNWR